MRVWWRDNETEPKTDFSFCETCGCRIGAQAVARPKQFCIRAGTLDDPSWFAPVLAGYGRSRAAWLSPPANATCFDTKPLDAELPTLRAEWDATWSARFRFVGN